MSSGGHWPGWQQRGRRRALRVAQLIAAKATSTTAKASAAITPSL